MSTPGPIPRAGHGLQASDARGAGRRRCTVEAARRCNGAAESIITGFLYSDGKRSGAFRVTTSDVTIDGFVCQNNNTNTGACPAGIVLAPSIAGSRVLNNIVQNNITGLFLSNNSTTKQCLIQHNVFLNNNAGPHVNNGGRGIYSDGELSGGKLVNVLIDANTFLCNLPNAGDKYQGGIAM